MQQPATEGSSKRIISVQDISDTTYILPEDVMTSLKEMDLLERRVPNKKGPQHSKVLVNKAAVLSWMAKNRVSTVDPVDANAFIKKAESVVSTSSD
jgi:hypothetical protein